MNYQETLEYMYNQLPMFQRLGAAAYKADLSATYKVCALVGNPEKDFPSVHIAGTNGKGSVAHMLASVLQEAGYKTGLYTSPHLRDFRERIRVNGKMIDQDYVVDFIHNYQEGFEQIQPSFFEMTFAMAIRYFSDKQVDIVVMETGMGGRLDSTNVVRSLCTAITNISFDHIQFLGDTVEKIAAEKAGIIKKDIPIVAGAMRSEALNVIRKKALDLNAPFYQADTYWKATFPDESTMFLDGARSVEVAEFPLRGDYQLFNLPIVAACVDVLSEQGFKISDTAFVNGLQNVVLNTSFAGRWQYLNHPDANGLRIICDTGHNEDGLHFVLQQLQRIQRKHLHFVLGMVNDKDVDAVLNLLPTDAFYYFTRPDIPRGLDAAILAKKAAEHALKGEICSSVKNALDRAVHNATNEDLVFVGGSTFVVAEVVG